MIHRTLNVSLLLAMASGLYACSSPQGAAQASWDCHSADVPNGSTVECVSTSTGAMTVGIYTCAPGDTSAGCPSPTSSPVAVGTGDYTFDAGDNGGYTFDAGAPSTPPVTVGGGDYDAGSGGYDQNGNPHAGGSGNPHDDGGSGNPHTGEGSSGGGGDTSGGGYTTSGGSNAGGGDSSGGGYTGTCDGSQTTCTKPPTCQHGSHASACGACVPDASGGDDCEPPSTGGCWVTGGGFIVDADGNDSFGGNAMPMKAGYIRGEWEHVDHGTGNKAHGEAQYLVCRHVAEPGPGKPNGPQHNFDINQVYFGGPARWFTSGAWADGYWFDVMAEDHGEGKSPNATNFGGPDYYHFTIRLVAGANQSGTVVYDTEQNLGGGNVQIHPPNNGHPFTSSQLPPWVSLQP